MRSHNLQSYETMHEGFNQKTNSEFLTLGESTARDSERRNNRPHRLHLFNDNIFIIIK